MKNHVVKVQLGRAVLLGPRVVEGKSDTLGSVADQTGLFYAVYLA
jgi:hypothetical protein